jgi:hypothetical protein
MVQLHYESLVITATFKLLELGASLDTADSNGHSSLKCAAKQGHLVLV